MASSRLAVGQVILAEEPYAHALHSDQVPERCDVTLEQGGLQRCSGCKQAWCGSRLCARARTQWLGCKLSSQYGAERPGTGPSGGPTATAVRA